MFIVKEHYNPNNPSKKEYMELEIKLHINTRR